MSNYNTILQTNNSSLEEIITQLNNMPDAGNTTGEDVTEETTAYTAKIDQLETAVAALETELQGKASGGGSGGNESIETCSVNISSDYSSFCTIFYQPDATHWNSMSPRALTVACNSVMFVSQGGYYKAHVSGGEILYEGSGVGFVYRVPNTPNASISISIETE